MSYKITEYTKKQAKKLNVFVCPSNRKNKKIDVYDNQCNYITSIGAKGYNDYPNYLELERKGKVEKGIAEQRRKAYKKRHIYRNVKGSRAFYADKLLW
jgi:hypothetical protein